MLYWYTIVCCYFYDTFCYFSVIRILVQMFCYLTLLCCAFSVISTIVLYVPHIEIKKGGLVTPPGGAAQALSSPQGLTNYLFAQEPLSILCGARCYFYGTRFLGRDGHQRILPRGKYLPHTLSIL